MIPAEVATSLLCQLTSFSDVFALSAVCRWLRHIWLNSVNQIYHQVAPRSISCKPAARRFLAGQDGPGMGSPLVAKDVVRMVQNAGVIENAVLQFEQNVVSRIKSKLKPNIRIVKHSGLIPESNSECSVS